MRCVVFPSLLHQGLCPQVRLQSTFKTPDSYTSVGIEPITIYCQIGKMLHIRHQCCPRVVNLSRPLASSAPSPKKTDLSRAQALQLQVAWSRGHRCARKYGLCSKCHVVFRRHIPRNHSCRGAQGGRNPRQCPLNRSGSIVRQELLTVASYERLLLRPRRLTFSSRLIITPRLHGAIRRSSTALP